MNNKLLLSACLMCLGMVGCVRQNSAYTAQCSGPDCPAEVYVDKTYAVPQDEYICQNSADPNLCPSDPFVNYTGTAADFRKYGERTPRDRMISQSGAGNNLSASIPPSVEDEVIEYEEQVSVTEEEPVEEKAAETPAVEEVTEDISVVDETTPEAEVDTVEEVAETVIADNDDNTEENPEDMEDPVQDWLAEEGQNLKALLTEWSEQSGWRLVWNTNRNYVLSAGAMFRGRFADVSSALIRAFARARPAPIATFYKGNRVLVVETMEDENAYE
ncbi:MAG: TcpQ domain-containing protein [Alphaproteobacteria bacterium]|nr:TcpQ domain-containing protein [Alphaproteobacteria bacterium]